MSGKLSEVLLLFALDLYLTYLGKVAKKTNQCFFVGIGDSLKDLLISLLFNKSSLNPMEMSKYCIFNLSPLQKVGRNIFIVIRSFGEADYQDLEVWILIFKPLPTHQGTKIRTRKF